ncbi:MAG: diaminopimelate epimerase [Thermodesulfovibrionales bacterium]
MDIYFTKMHGLGNDFILLDGIKDPHLLGLDFATMGPHLCHRRFGIGADQILLLTPSTMADFQMRIFNADGSEVEMCGNGIRCLAHYIWKRGLSNKKILGIETKAGIIRPERVNDLVKVDMGEPIFDPERIPVNITDEFLKNVFEGKVRAIIDYPLQIDDRLFKITCLSMGNPHTVIVVDKVEDFQVGYYGPMIENNGLFPKRTNVEFIEILNPSEIRMRVWERGSGETMACGTGASAAAVAMILKGLTKRDVMVHLLGGDLQISWASDNHVYMTGPAKEVFEGKIAV